MATEIIDIEVKSNIQFASDHAAALAENLGKAKKETKDLSKATKESKKGWIATNLSAKALGLTLKGMGIGLIVSAIAMLTRAFYQNKKVAAEVTKVMNTVSNAATDIIDVFIETAVWVSESSARFNGLAKVLGGMITIQLTPLKLAFYGLKISVQSLLLSWERSPLGGGDPGRIKELQDGIKQTGRDILDVGKNAIQAGKDIYNNIGDAIGEVDDIYNVLTTSFSKFKLDNKTRGEDTQAVKDEMTDLEKFILALNERTAQAEADSDEKKIEREREKHIAELDKLEVNAEEKAILKEQLDKLYDDRLTEIRLAREKTEAEAMEALRQENELAAEENIFARAKRVLEIQKTTEDEALKGHDNYLKLKEELDIKYAKKFKDVEKDKADFAKASVQSQISAFGNLSGALSSLAGDNKELSAASAIIDTYTGANKALAQGGVLGWASAAAIITAGLVNVKKIYETDVGSGGGGSSGASAMPPAPQMMSGAFELGGGQPVEPARAYVVSDDITNNQNKLAIIRRRATI
jgi:hypothetical protein